MVAAKIQALRTELRALEFELDSLMRDDDRAPRDRPADGGDASYAQQVIDLLDKDPEKVFGVEEIARTLRLDNITSLRSTLARLAREGKGSKAGRGRYRSVTPLAAADKESAGHSAGAEASEGMVPH